MFMSKLVLLPEAQRWGVGGVWGVWGVWGYTPSMRVIREV